MALSGPFGLATFSSAYSFSVRVRVRVRDRDSVKVRVAVRVRVWVHGVGPFKLASHCLQRCDGLASSSSSCWDENLNFLDLKLI